jgi:hypothetical protein
MAGIEIKDLPDSLELDRDAMKAIYGGSKTPLMPKPNRASRRARDQGLVFFPAQKSRKNLGQ